LPFDARCASRAVEVSQFVARGQSLGTFVDVSSIEVVAMLELRQMRALFPEGIRSLGPVDLQRLMDPDESVFASLRVPVEVCWEAGREGWIWPGRVARIAGSLDAATRTVPVIVEVPHPYRDIQPGVRPPLIPDVFCELTIYGETVDAVVIPREALHDDRVYLLRDGELHVQKVTVLAREERRAVISAGLDTGDRVILADPVPLTGRPSATETFPASRGPFPEVEKIRLRGREVRNPVSPRTGTRIEFPAGIFEAADPPIAFSATEDTP
jgi:multidrug efflux pump subunit AcrA (membrane-fusion protein)